MKDHEHTVIKDINKRIDFMTNLNQETSEDLQVKISARFLFSILSKSIFFGIIVLISQNKVLRQKVSYKR